MGRPPLAGTRAALPINHLIFTKVSLGYPLRQIAPLHAEQPLAELGIAGGDSITVQLDSNGPFSPTSASASCEPGMQLRVMPDDNSCLFSAVGYVLCGRSRAEAGALRQLAARLILSDAAGPALFSEAVLGKPPAIYAEWVQKSKSWGGAIELSLFSAHFAVQIASIDVASGRVDVFGEDQAHQKRAYLLYSGIHYDALARLAGPGAPEAADQTVFDSTDDSVLVQAMQVAEMARLEHRYTDLAKFTLSCETCQTALVGEKEAEQHAVSTGHTAFQEYSQSGQ